MAPTFPLPLSIESISLRWSDIYHKWFWFLLQRSLPAGDDTYDWRHWGVGRWPHEDRRCRWAIRLGQWWKATAQMIIFCLFYIDAYLTDAALWKVRYLDNNIISKIIMKFWFVIDGIRWMYEHKWFKLKNSTFSKKWNKGLWHTYVPAYTLFIFRPGL